MLKADFSTSWSRDLKRCLKKHWSREILNAAVRAVLFSDEKPIPASFNDHALTGEWKGYRSLHLERRNSNWIMLYQVVGDEVFFIATGTHDEVYG